jgi:hypothetical protein
MTASCNPQAGAPEADDHQAAGSASRGDRRREGRGEPLLGLRRGGRLVVLRDRSTARQAEPGWLVAPRLPVHGNQPEGAGPSRITPRTWSTDTPSHGNSTIHHVAPADA